MIFIANIDEKRFSLNGIPYYKNFMPYSIAGRVKIINAYDSKLALSELLLPGEYSVNGIVYGSAATLQAALLPVLYTRASLGDGGGTSIDQDNIPIQIPISGSFGMTRNALATAINLKPSFTITETQVVDFVLVSNSVGGARTIVFKLNGLGKGTYGVGGTPVTGEDIRIISVRDPQVADIADAQIISLGEIGDVDVAEVIDQGDEIELQGGLTAIAEVLREGEPFAYLFKGDEGNYGDGSGNVTVGMWQLLGASGSGGGDFVPLTGTAEGNPVTGEIEFLENGKNIWIKGADNDGFHYLSLTEGNIGFRSFRQSTGEHFGLSLSENGVQLLTNNPTSRGLTSGQDFTANITALDYTQKKYVDQAIADAAIGGGAVSGDNVADNAERDAYDIPSLPFTLFVDDDGDGNWALYMATTTGVGANFVKISDPDLLNAVMSNAAIKTAYESNANTNAFTDAEKTKLGGIASGATANDTDINLKNRANHTGAQAISTITGLQAALDAQLPKIIYSSGTASNWHTGTMAITTVLTIPLPINPPVGSIWRIQIMRLKENAGNSNFRMYINSATTPNRIATYLTSNGSAPTSRDISVLATIARVTDNNASYITDQAQQQINGFSDVTVDWTVANNLILTETLSDNSGQVRIERVIFERIK